MSRLIYTHQAWKSRKKKKNRGTPQAAISHRLKHERTRYEIEFEQQLRDFYREIGINPTYEIQKPIGLKNGYFCYPDFVARFHNRQVIFEIDGSVHLTTRAAQWDQIKEQQLARIGYRVLRITNTQVRTPGYVQNFLEENIRPLLPKCPCELCPIHKKK